MKKNIISRVAQLVRDLHVLLILDPVFEQPTCQVVNGETLLVEILFCKDKYIEGSNKYELVKLAFKKEFEEENIAVLIPEKNDNIKRKISFLIPLK